MPLSGSCTFSLSPEERMRIRSVTGPATPHTASRVAAQRRFLFLPSIGSSLVQQRRS